MLCTTSTAPGARPPSKPCGSRTTSRTSASAKTQTHAMSLARPSATGDGAAAVPPNASRLLGRRAHSVVGKPAATMRRTIGAPMSPSPTNPIRGRPAGTPFGTSMSAAPSFACASSR
ncbi:hypothetical protein BJF78_00525 [Pseudonocardia sp. CNS-139]|nr:hypothetical protein BJF78_00525 [Pseudonocardia sp. CNS-139]